MKPAPPETGYKALLESLRRQLLGEETRENGLAAPAEKKYFRVREVAELLGVEPHVLRYWEREFGAIRPKKSRSGQRIYDRKDLHLLQQVQTLLHVEKLNLQGAKRKLIEMRKKPKIPLGQPKRGAAFLTNLAHDVQELVRLIERIGPSTEPLPARQG
jgi:DNA-binding transcriptional MerR regulator